MLEMINTTSTVLTAGNAIPFTTVTFDTNGNISGTPAEGIASITVPGFYLVTGTFVIEATATGNVTVNMMTDGTAETGATAEFSAADANTIETISISKVIQVTTAAAGNTAQVSFDLATGSAASTLLNATMQAIQIR